MQVTKLQPKELAVIETNNGLKLYLDGLVNGKAATPRSALYNIPGKTEMLEPDDVLNRWKEQLESLAVGSNFEQEVFQFDSRQLEKWGPQGQVAPISELLEPIVEPSFSTNTSFPGFSSREWDEAKSWTAYQLHCAGCRGLRPVALSRVVDDMRARDTLESNSGWPLFTRRSKPEVVRQSIEEAEDGRWKTYPAIALFRNYNRKTRLVWMFPMSANLVEGSFFQILQSVLMRSKLADQFLAPWNGFETVRKLITDKYATGEALAASDFSSTDAHFKLPVTMEVCDVLESCFQPAYRSALRESMTYMHTIPLIIGPDNQIEGEHGVSSGSNWTNFVETIFDMILARYVSNLEEQLLHRPAWQNYQGLYAIGDDMSWSVKRSHYDPDFSVRLEKYGESVGMQVKAEKTTNDPDKVKSLQRLFQAGYLRNDGLIRAVYPTIRALKSLIYPEREHPKKLWSKDMAAVRAFMILENCVDHPLFEKFCRFVAQGDPHLAEFARLSAEKQNYLFRKSKLIPGLNPTYNQERRNGSLSTFRSIEVISKL